MRIRREADLSVKKPRVLDTAVLNKADILISIPTVIHVHITTMSLLYGLPLCFPFNSSVTV